MSDTRFSIYFLLRGVLPNVKKNNNKEKEKRWKMPSV